VRSTIQVRPTTLKEKSGRGTRCCDGEPDRTSAACIEGSRAKADLWLVGQVDPFHDDDLQPLRLSVADYAALFGRQGQGSIYQELEEVTTGLLSKVIEIAFPGQARRKKFQWLSHAEYLDGEGIVLVQLHESLKPFLLALKKEFARVPLLEVLRLRSRYAMAFYQMCCSWYGSNGRSWTLTLDEIREWLHIEEGEESKSLEVASDRPGEA
jgi:plasmid replication initiation protein